MTGGAALRLRSTSSSAHPHPGADEPFVFAIDARWIQTLGDTDAHDRGPDPKGQSRNVDA